MWACAPSNNKLPPPAFRRLSVLLMLVGRNMEWTVLGLWMGHRVGEGEGWRWWRDRMGRRRMEG